MSVVKKLAGIISCFNGATNVICNSGFIYVLFFILLNDYFVVSDNINNTLLHVFNLAAVEIVDVA